MLRGPAAPLDAAALVSEQVFVTADDGAAIPLFLTRRRDIAPTGEAPALLVGYGGFDIAMTPAFMRRDALFVERGGILAVAVLRGGGEYGRGWHDAGRLANKQRVFDDFCACARWLASSGWSRPGRIAINGGSNGGLLVGACLTQHPELFGAAVAEVGVLDMLRFHKLHHRVGVEERLRRPRRPRAVRLGAGLLPTAQHQARRWLPATLITTGDHDDRVVPWPLLQVRRRPTGGSNGG